MWWSCTVCRQFRFQHTRSRIIHTPMHETHAASTMGFDWQSRKWLITINFTCRRSQMKTPSISNAQHRILSINILFNKLFTVYTLIIDAFSMGSSKQRGLKFTGIFERKCDCMLNTILSFNVTTVGGSAIDTHKIHRYIFNCIFTDIYINTKMRF